MKKAFRRQIKQDELVSGYEEFGIWVGAHADAIKATAAGVAVLAVALGALWHFRSQRVTSSEQAFAEAMAAYSASRAETPPTASTEAQPASREEKLKKAATAFDGVADRFQSLPVGLRARYFAAVCRIELGDLAQAEKDLGVVAARGASSAGGLEASLARLALAGVKRRQGAIDEAVRMYEEMLRDPSGVLPSDYVLTSLGDTLQQAGRYKEAAAVFRRVVEEYPQRPFAGDARNRADSLKLASAE